MKDYLAKIKTKVVETSRNIIKDERGMELVQIVILAVVAIVLGGVILKLFKGSFEELFPLMTEKIKSIFNM